ncbi:MAG: potassium channel family protein [Candidatus Nanoarchaeia archaeon]|nr:potassium channel family protein [Candidatus Nanoarchaeia archaeon]
MLGALKGGVINSGISIRKKKIGSWFDRVTFTKILVVWICIVLLFGLLYYVFAGDKSNLHYSATQKKVDSLRDSVYFSFVAATTTGFGDIVPAGSFKMVSIVELIFGLLILAVVTSKLVSIKQDAIMAELYEISFHEKINRLRSSLLLFRQNINHLISEVEEGIIKKTRIHDLEFYISSFGDTLREVSNSITRPDQNEFIKGLGPLDTELLLNSIISSFEKLEELVDGFEKKNIRWKTETNLASIKKVMGISENIFDRLPQVKSLMENTFHELGEHYKKTSKELRERIEKS